MTIKIFNKHINKKKKNSMNQIEIKFKVWETNQNKSIKKNWMNMKIKINKKTK